MSTVDVSFVETYRGVMMSGAAALAEDRRPRGSVPVEVHRVLWEEYERTGSSPPPNIIAELTGIDTTAVRRALRTLHEEGLVTQPHGDRAPYIPLCRPDGTRIRHVLVPEGEEAPLAQQRASALLEEALRKVRVLEQLQRDAPPEPEEES